MNTQKATIILKREGQQVFHLPIHSVGSTGVTCVTGADTGSPATEWFPFKSQHVTAILPRSLRPVIGKQAPIS